MCKIKLKTDAKQISLLRSGRDGTWYDNCLRYVREGGALGAEMEAILLGALRLP